MSLAANVHWILTVKNPDAYVYIMSIYGWAIIPYYSLNGFVSSRNEDMDLK